MTYELLLAQRAELDTRVNSYRQYELKSQERETLATEVVPDEQVLTRARELAQTIAGYPAKGITAVKQGLRAATTRGAPQDWFDTCMPDGAKA